MESYGKARDLAQDSGENLIALAIVHNKGYRDFQKVCAECSSQAGIE